MRVLGSRKINDRISETSANPFYLHKRFALVVISILILMPLTGYLYIQGKWVVEPLHIGGIIPSVMVKDLSGRLVRTDSLITGKTVIIFFSTTCLHCKNLLGEVASLYPRFNDSLSFVGISINNEIETDRFMAEMNLPLNALVDVDNTARERFHVRPVPTLFFVNKQRRLVSYFVGERDSIALRSELLQFEKSIPEHF